ncbi:ankyrin repeat family protein [Orientia tsutsugamushi str. Gilliam]|uniref:Ankyrin repeat family protein n=1 Tax=Orientia tsutsugamushi str. Gilliam TaxID=1359184 RepID=A0A0F3MAP1_ORITS|nr:ankyrin repeat domain-containing protein [Orientia tsutsugamushi]KJV52833.1 ankyrin repeat family protein [Orientia tsutsugamushi str. Gilliam]
MLDRGAHINQLNNNGVGALHAAIRFAKVKVVSYLLDAGAKHDTSLDTDYFTLLSYAIRVNDYNPKIIKMILDKGYLNAGIFDLDAKDFCVQHPYPYNPHTVEEYTLIKLIKFLYSKGNIDKHSNETFIDITHVDIKDEDLPYYFDQAKFDEVCTEFCLYYSNTEISLYSNNLPITTQIMDNLNKIAVRKILINDLKEEYNKYQNDNSLEKKQLPLFDINFDCIQHLLNKLSNKDIFNFNRSVCNTCIDEVQDDLNKLNISVEGESYTNEIQQEESENDICVIG